MRIKLEPGPLPLLAPPPRSMEVAGIHGSAVQCIPLFLVYLATLTHTYSLATRHAAAGYSPSGPYGKAGREGEEGAVSVVVEQPGEGAAARSPPRRRGAGGAESALGDALSTGVNSLLRRLGYWALEASLAGNSGAACTVDCLWHPLRWMLL